MKKTVIELFAGVGGFRLGLEKAADFEVVWANQFEPSRKIQHAYNCYTSHFETGIHSNEDITKVEAANIPDHNVLVGGFPCQDYSVARTGAEGIQGKKGVLFWEIKRIVEEKKPPFILLENVDRLLKSPSQQRGRDFLVMLTILWNLGYGVEWRVVNAADYGFAQKRKRIFIFAYHKETKYYRDTYTEELGLKNIENGYFSAEFPILGESEKHKSTEVSLIEDVVEVSDTYKATLRNSGIMLDGKVYSAEIIPDQSEEISTLGGLLESGVEESYYLNDDQLASWEYLKGSKSIPRTSSTGHTYNYSEGQMAFPDILEKPARTILTSEASKNRSSHVVADPETGRLRTLTPLECERINGFDDNWTASGMPHKFRYFCMGNALVVGLIEKMGRRLANIIELE